MPTDTASRSVLTTPDGRQLEYLVTGPPDGPVLLFQVGTPNPAMNFTRVTGPATALGLRTISYSRPGYGDSTELRGRTVADAVTDIRTLLDTLGVDRFRTLGWSGGGPHALATGALLPDRCQAVAVLAGVAPHDAAGLDFLQGMDQGNVDEFSAAVAGFDEIDGFLQPLTTHFQTVTGASIVEALAGLLSEVDQAALTGQFAEQMAQAFRHAMKNGIAGWRDDDLAFVRPWGFNLNELTVPVAIWQGRQDRMVPFGHGQWLAAEVPGAQPHLFADQGHLSLIAQMDTVLADLVRL
ncbi:MAG: alpha/beta fold hydrolase [Jatrophihabitans sp.]